MDDDAAMCILAHNLTGLELRLKLVNTGLLLGIDDKPVPVASLTKMLEDAMVRNITSLVAKIKKTTNVDNLL